MARTFGLIGLIILFALALYYNKRNAQKRCTFLQNYINSNKEEVNAIIIAFFEGNLVQKTIDPLLRNKERAYLIINRNSYLTVIAMNNDKQQTILKNQYDKINKKLDKQNPTYKFYLESYSVFYRFEPPYEYIILRIDS